MIGEINELLVEYRAWLKAKTTLREVSDWVEITTPFLDRHNDCIQIYARRDNATWVLTDDGYTMADLQASGCEIGQTGKRRDILNNTLRGFGVAYNDDDSLVVRASDAEFAFKKHNLIQAILGVGDLFYLSRSRVISVFFEDVRKWFDDSRIRYTSNIRLTGRSGFDHQFDFIIPHSDRRPERLVKLLNFPDKQNAENLIFASMDIRDSRPGPLTPYAIINDQRDVPDGVIEALATYNVRTVRWSQKDGAMEELAA